MPAPNENPAFDQSTPGESADSANLDALSRVEGQAEDPSLAPKKSFLRKWIKRLAIFSIASLTLLAMAVYLILYLAKIEPEFYSKALRVDSEEQKKFGSQMETVLLDLHNSIIVSDEWSAEFTEKQLNGWLAWDLEKKFPKLLPPQISDPRVDIDDKDEISLAFRCDSKPYEGIGIIKGEIFLSGVVNQIGIRIKSIRSGLVPIPFALFADQVAVFAEKSEIDIEWTDHDGDPVVLVDIPEPLLRHSGNYIEFKSVKVGDEKIRIAGVTHVEEY